MGTPLRAIGLVTVVALLLGACAPAVPKSLQTVRVAIPANGAPYAPYFIAMEKGYYADEGIQVQMVEAAGNTGVASLVAGDTEFTTSAGVALSAILQGAELKVIFSNMDRPSYQLWSSQPDIKTLQDLRGKPVAVIGRGDSMEISARMVLARAGLDPSGVAYTALGPGGGRVAAVQSGAVGAALLTVADVEQLKRAGPKGNMVSDIRSDVRMLFNGIATGDRLLRERPELAAGFVRATVKGREYFRRYKDESIDIVGKYNNQPREVNAPDYDATLASMTADGTLPEDAQLADATVRAGMIGAPAVRPIGEIYDYSLVRKVYREIQQSGWQPQR